jgi:hypothetical protein
MGVQAGHAVGMTKPLRHVSRDERDMGLNLRAYVLQRVQSRLAPIVMFDWHIVRLLYTCLTT